jgi:hypothetical protein
MVTVSPQVFGSFGSVLFMVCPAGSIVGWPSCSVFSVSLGWVRRTRACMRECKTCV